MDLRFAYLIDVPLLLWLDAFADLMSSVSVVTKTTAEVGDCLADVVHPCPWCNSVRFFSFFLFVFICVWLHATVWKAKVGGLCG